MINGEINLCAIHALNLALGRTLYGQFIKVLKLCVVKNHFFKILRLKKWNFSGSLTCNKCTILYLYRQFFVGRICGARNIVKTIENATLEADVTKGAVTAPNVTVGVVHNRLYTVKITIAEYNIAWRLPNICAQITVVEVYV